MKPPGPNQHTYRGKIRADIRSAYNHMLYLWRWHNKFSVKTNITYPNQLAPPEEIDLLTNAMALMYAWLQSTGPIPDAADNLAARNGVIELLKRVQLEFRPGTEPPSP